MDLVKLLALASLLTIGVAFMVGVIAFVIFSINLHREIEGEILWALQSHFPPETRASINRRSEFDDAHQICFDVDVSTRGTRSTRKIIMVSGDHDGRNWRFAREYNSTSDCENGFDRG